MALADTLEARGDELIDAAVARIQERVPAYRDLDGALLREVRNHVREHHALIVKVLNQAVVSRGVV